MESNSYFPVAWTPAAVKIHNLLLFCVDYSNSCSSPSHVAPGGSSPVSLAQMLSWWEKPVSNQQDWASLRLVLQTAFPGVRRRLWSKSDPFLFKATRPLISATPAGDWSDRNPLKCCYFQFQTWVLYRSFFLGRCTGAVTMVIIGIYY